MQNIPTPLAGNRLLQKLRELFDHYDFSNLKQTSFALQQGIDLYYIRCNGINAFIDFTKTNLRLSLPTAFHDSIKYLVNRLFLNSKGRLEIRQSVNYIDLICEGLTHEVKTIEYVEESDFRKKLRDLVKVCIEQRGARRIWWICFLHQAKTIKGRVCVYFLGFIRMEAEIIKTDVNVKGIDAVVDSIADAQKSLEKEVIREDAIYPEELAGEFLFGVENAIVSSLRSDVLSLKDKVEQLASEKEQLASEKEQLASEKEQLASEKERLAKILEKYKAKFGELPDP